MITILNTSILTNHGIFQYYPIPLEKAKELVHSNSFQSAIGHESTAKIISDLLDIECPVNRIQYKQMPEEQALVFKLKGRSPEGKVLSKEEIEEIGYEWAIITSPPQAQIRGIWLAFETEEDKKEFLRLWDKTIW